MHGKIIYYPKDKKQASEFINLLPKRNDYLNADKLAVIKENVKLCKPLLFLPNDVVELNIKINGKMQYKLLLIGILTNGSKASVVLENIYPFFDIQVPKDTETFDFEASVKKIFQNQNVYYRNIDVIKKYPFKGFQEEKSDYLRVSFYTLFSRTKALKYVLESEKWETASDDKSCYYRKVAREYRFQLCNWNEISNYTIDESMQYCKRNQVEFTFLVDVNDFTPATNIPNELLKDYSMIGVWDTETDSRHPTGNPPLPENVLNEKGEEEDVVRMQAMVFYWYWSDTPLVRVNITDMVCPARDDCLTIMCNNQEEIIKTSVLLLERMSPEFYAGFNDGMYDWPFIIERAKHYNIVDFMKKHMTVLEWTPELGKYTIAGEKKEMIKVEADAYVDNIFFSVPGFICLDVRTIFRQLYPTAEKSSLNFFLAANKLGSKEDMPYQTMFKIFRLMRQLAKLYNTSDFKKIIQKLNEEIALHGADYQLFKNHNDQEFNPFTEIDNTIYSVNNLTLADIIELAEQAERVVLYCNVDAQRCQELLRMRSIIPDKREVSNLAFTSMGDALFRAGGMKVRNLVISEGIRPEWDIVFSNIAKESKDKRKYPGAYVVPPKKGLYRDHKFDKRRRRESFKLFLEKATAEEIEAEVRRSDFNQVYPLTADEMQNNDTKDCNDLPCAGLDFSSLYPSIIMTYNLSPEKVIQDENYKKYLENKIDRFNKPYKTVEIKFRYGFDGQAEEDKELIHGWMVQHHPTKDKTFEGMGLYPFILKRLFDQRSQVKKKMEYYQLPKEFLDKVFESRKLSILQTDLIEEQKNYVKNALAIETAKRKAEWEKFQKPYYESRLHVMHEIEHFMEKEFYPSVDGIDKLYDEIIFQFNYLNVKQNALKVFMNTFYGEAGNSQSPFFLPHVAGGTTTYGQKNIKLVKAHTEKSGFDVKYGDTDSLYISPPAHYFADVEKQYENGVINKQQYWTRMIEISMEVLDKYKDEVGDLLFNDNGTRFLKMAYEEILFPYAFVGKKKYIGIQHQGIVNLHATMPTCSLDEFMKSKTLFIRGLEVKKRGSSQFLKISCFEVIKESFCIANNSSLKEIVENKMKEIPKKKWSPELFLKSAKYKLPGKNADGELKKGNVTVLRFVERMKILEEKFPDVGIKSPELGERFNYIVSKKYPWTYNLRGSKVNIKVGDKYEYFESINNAKYAALLDDEVQVDIDYYMLNEIIGQFSRFVIYHPEYDKFFTEDMYENDEEYKKADKSAHGYAKKKLQKYYKDNFASNYLEKSNVCKKIFKASNNILYELLEERYGPATELFRMTDTLITSSNIDEEEDIKTIFTDSHTKTKLRDLILKKCKKVGDKMAKSYVSHIMNETKLPARDCAELYIPICQQKDQYARQNLTVYRSQLDNILPAYQKLCLDNVKLLETITKEIKEKNNIDKIGNKPVEKEEVFEAELNTDAEIPNLDINNHLIDEMYNIYIKICVCYQQMEECQLIKSDLDYYRAKKFDSNVNPFFATSRRAMKAAEEFKKATKDDFLKWLSNNKNTK